jgi:hypothetical protein
MIIWSCSTKAIYDGTSQHTLPTIMMRAIIEAAYGAYMAEKFRLVWALNGENTAVEYSTQNEALQRSEVLLRGHGCDLEIALYLVEPPSVLFNKRRMRGWCLSGFPTVII